MMNWLLQLTGLELTPTNHTDKLISGLGGLVAIAAMMWLTTWLVGPTAVVPVVASMGASAVLLFATPHGQLSQPWPLVVGHLASAAIGVTCARLIAHPALGGALAVGLAITVMYYGRCVHPPGGATALIAVLGGPALRDLGYGYVLLPVGLNVLLMLLVAVAFNYPFAWRRYPAGLLKPRRSGNSITRDDWGHALQQIGSLADVTEDDLIELHALAAEHARTRQTARSRSVRTPTTTPAR
jgi:CBS-domain-containing membrane protein